MSAFIIVVAAVLILPMSYFLAIRPWQLRWGATDAEVVRRLAGDDIVKNPHFKATRAVTIQAPPAEVWPWLLQIGSARGGWYSLDWLDNSGQPSTWEILPAFQKIENDYFVPFTPNQKNGMWVKEFSEFAYILWWDKKGKATWGWYLEEIGDHHTRLITRLRTTYDFRFPWVIYYLIYDFGDIVMMRKCLLGIKARAEADYHRLNHTFS